MKKILFALIFSFNLSAFAALPPLHESVKEFQSLLNNPFLTKNLSVGESITEIAKDHDEFIVTTTKSVMIVKIIYEPQKMPGPAHFRFEFEPPKVISEEK